MYGCVNLLTRSRVFVEIEKKMIEKYNKLRFFVAFKYPTSFSREKRESIAGLVLC